VDDRANLAGARWLAFRQQLTCLSCGHDHWTAQVRWEPRTHWVITCRSCQSKLVDPRGLNCWQPK
jgi:hypothetical protein